MDKEEIQAEIVPENEIVPFSERPVDILRTDADLYEEDINGMSDFMELYLQKMLPAIKTNSIPGKPLNLPVADLEVIGEIGQNIYVLMKGESILTPDFDSLPSDIKNGLDTKTLHLGDSKQVPSNKRSVVVDEHGTRVKDVTLKEEKVRETSSVSQIIHNFAHQYQLQKINERLARIENTVNRNADKNRRRNIYNPFFSAREYIRKAQNAESREKRDVNLEKAIDYLIQEKRELKEDINDCLNAIKDQSHTYSFFQNPLAFISNSSQDAEINIEILHITEDLGILTKTIGLTLQVYEYLGQQKDRDDAIIQYNKWMYKWASDKNYRVKRGNKEIAYSAFGLIHTNFVYTDFGLSLESQNFWHDFSRTIIKELNPKKQLDYNHVYVLERELIHE